METALDILEACSGQLGCWRQPLPVLIVAPQHLDFGKLAEGLEKESEAAEGAVAAAGVVAVGAELRLKWTLSRQGEQ